MQIAIPDQALIANGFVAASRQIAIATNIPNSVNRITTQGFYTASDGGGAVFTRVAGPLSDGASFQSADGAWWQIASNPVTPYMFGAKGDGVTDDITALNNFGAFANKKHMPNGQYYITTYPFNIMGSNPTQTNDVSWQGMTCDPGATVIQGTDNIPVITVYGSRNTINFPIVQHLNPQGSTNYGAVGILIENYPGSGAGLYVCNIPNIIVKKNSNTGVAINKGFSSTLNANAAGGATVISVANAPTSPLGAYPFIAGMFIQIKLDDNTFHITRIKSVAGSNITLVNALPSAASIGNIVGHSSVIMTNLAPTISNMQLFQCFFTNIFINSPTYIGWLNTVGGTDNVFGQRYILGTYNIYPTVSDTCSYAIYETNCFNDFSNTTNIEHLRCTVHAWWHDTGVGTAGINGGSAAGTIHFENVELINDSGLLAGYCRSWNIGIFETVYTRMIDAGLVRAALFFPSSTNVTSIGGNKGTWNINTLITNKNMITPGKGFIVRDASNNQISVNIGDWQYLRDGGFYPTGQLTYPFNFACLARIGNLLPVNCFSFAFDVNVNDNATYNPVYTYNKMKYSIDKVFVSWPSLSMTTATGGLYADNVGATLISSVNNNSLAALTSTSKKVEFALAAGEATTLRNAGTSLYYKTATAQALPAAIVSGAGGFTLSSYLTGRGGGSQNTNLGFINFGQAHNLTVGQIVTISGASGTTTALNGTFKIVDVPSATQITVYADSVNAVGSAGAPVNEPTMQVQLIPTINVYVTGSGMGAN